MLVIRRAVKYGADFGFGREGEMDTVVEAKAVDEAIENAAGPIGRFEDGCGNTALACGLRRRQSGDTPPMTSSSAMFRPPL